uniref:G-patch domain containing 1 n=1 Tax=Cynoglossus semilaevis TaxID=244447 RepID=A0A3P8X0D3_CYNSE
MASDNEKDEDFVTYGTVLEPLGEDEPLKKPVPLHEQTVKDEKGRYQRFHGAFTGGFSAGYYNTVGTKEGWTPSTFVSSRGQKAEICRAKPEDFMDEEDFGEHGIAPQQITTSQEFPSSHTDKVGERAKAIRAQTTLTLGDILLQELIRPCRSSIGIKLLKKMGWKEGQGVGPRVKRRARRLRGDRGVKVYGCAVPANGSEESEEDEDELLSLPNVTFAPQDVTPVDFDPKIGVQGLGYCGLDPGLALLGQGNTEHFDLFKPVSVKRGGVAQKNSRAFGINKDGDDDVYHRDSMSKYDIEIREEEPGDGLYGWTAPQQYTKTRDVSYNGKIMDGFTCAKKPAAEKKIFLPPVLPPGFRPYHGFCPSALASTSVSSALAHALTSSRGHMVQEKPQQAGRHQMDISQRRALLGEDILPNSNSVMELLNPDDRQHLLSMQTHVNSLDSFKLDLMESEHSGAGKKIVPTSTSYRPMSSVLSSRFTKAKHKDDDNVVVAGLDKKCDLDDQQAAVQMKMFGKMTRETFEWYPDKLLCKRFNVPDPYPGSGVVGLSKVKKDKFSVFNFLTVTEDRKKTDTRKKSRWDVSDQNNEMNKDTPTCTTSDVGISDQIQEMKNDGEKEETEVEECSRPPLDIFKAIFVSSDEKSSEETSSEGESEDEVQDIMKNTEISSTISPVISNAPLPSTFPEVLSASDDNYRSTEKQGVPQISMQEEFGPRLPPCAVGGGQSTSLSSFSREKKKRRKTKQKKHKYHKSQKDKKVKKKKKD